MEAKAVLEKSQVFAVIGLSDQSEKYSYKIYQCLKALGKEVYGISKRLKVLEGECVYASLKDIPCDIDVAVFVVAPKYGSEYVLECKEKSVSYLWLQPGTYDDDLIEQIEATHIPYYLDCVLRKAEEIA